METNQPTAPNSGSGSSGQTFKEYDLAKIDPIAAAIYRGWAGIPWAGAIYGMLIAVLLGFIEFFMNGFPSSIGWVLTLIPFFVGLLVATFAGVVSCYLSWLFHRTFLGLLCCRTAVAISGGLAGFLSTFWIVFASPINWTVEELRFLIILTSLVGGAILAGQIGALWCASPKRKWNDLELSLDTDGRQFQFEIKHILILMIWISVVLGLDQLTGNANLLIATCFYVIVQAICITADRLITRKRLSHAAKEV